MTKIVANIQNYIEVSINEQKQVFTVETAQQLHDALHEVLRVYYAKGGVSPNPVEDKKVTDRL